MAATKKRFRKAKTPPLPPAETYEFVVMAGVEGPFLYLNDFCIAHSPWKRDKPARQARGPKPWGGGKVLQRFEATHDDLRAALMRHTDYVKRSREGDEKKNDPLTVTCPTCKSGKTLSCITGTGLGRTTHPHAARKHKADHVASKGGGGTRPAE